MPATVHVSSLWLTGIIITAIFAIVYPLILAIIAHQRLKVGWKYFGFGMLIFLIFQLVSRVPIVTILGSVLAPQLKSSPAFLYTWIVILTITAGLFEEVGRYIGYRWFMRREEKTWSKAVMYGIGHGGLESMVLVGGGILLTVLNVIVLSVTNLNSLPASQHALIVHQLATINAQPWWLSLAGAWERFWTLFIHIALSVVVLQVFRRSSIVWLWLAVLAHAVVDFTTVIIPQLIGASVSSTLLTEGLVAIFGILSVIVIWRLRESTPATVETHPVVPTEAV
ncbi:MAG TPA: YhfC family intramembrane metalloprotease [Ktedonobacter sp.]|nr:YhfC family intramembrane metalloprotease [Ktedonobacter sp.]